MDRPGSSSSSARKKRPPAPPAKSQPSAASILDRLDAVDDSKFRNRRGASRHRFRRSLVPIRVRHPGGSICDSRVATRNLSNSGVGFLYNSFLHNGTEVSVTLERRLGGVDVLEGRVVYCQHVAGAYHQIGVRFKQKIFAMLYAEDEQANAALATEAAVVAAATFTGRLLMIDSQPMDRALVGHHFRGTSVQIVPAETLSIAIAALIDAKPSKFDAVLCEVDVAIPGEGIAATFAGLRGAGHTGAIVISTPTTASTEVRQALLEAGAVAVLTKPYDRAEVQAALSHGVSAAGVDHAITTAERGISEVDALLKTVESAKKAG